MLNVLALSPEVSMDRLFIHISDHTLVSLSVISNVLTMTSHTHFNLPSFFSTFVQAI